MKNIFPQADNFLDALRISWCDLCQFLHQDGSTNQVKHFDHKEHLDTGHTCRQATIKKKNKKKEDWPLSSRTDKARTAGPGSSLRNSK